MKQIAHAQKACPLDSPANIRPGAENATHEILRESRWRPNISQLTSKPNHSSSTICLQWTFATIPS